MPPSTTVILSTMTTMTHDYADYDDKYRADTDDNDHADSNNDDVPTVTTQVRTSLSNFHLNSGHDNINA
jgi:hypothetical protein